MRKYIGYFEFPRWRWPLPNYGVYKFIIKKNVSLRDKNFSVTIFLPTSLAATYGKFSLSFFLLLLRSLPSSLLLFLPHFFYLFFFFLLTTNFIFSANAFNVLLIQRVLRLLQGPRPVNHIHNLMSLSMPLGSSLFDFVSIRVSQKISTWCRIAVTLRNWI